MSDQSIKTVGNYMSYGPDGERVAAFATEQGRTVFEAAPELLAALKDVAEQIAAYDYLHGANSCAIDDAPALAAIRDINPCYDPTVNIYRDGDGAIHIGVRGDMPESN